MFLSQAAGILSAAFFLIQKNASFFSTFFVDTGEYL